jgi:hypothetical protein
MDLENPSDRDRAGIALALAQAFAAGIQGGVFGAITFMDFLVTICQIPEEIAKGINDRADKEFLKGIKPSLLPPDPMATPAKGVDPQKSDGRGAGDSPIRGGIGHGISVE